MTPTLAGEKTPRVTAPPRRMRSARALAALGRLLIVAGAVVLLFVAYQLWGTGFREAASQRALRSEFEQQVSAATPAPPPRPTADGADGADGKGPVADGDPEARDALEPDPVPPPAPGEPVGILRIPKLGLDKVVVEGTDVASLRKGPGHQPGTAPLGGPGNAVIGGHRTTYGAPFYRLDELQPGDAIAVQLPSGEVRYIVTGSQVVEPTDVWILDPTPDDRLTLFTCTPRFSAAQRLVVTAALESPPAIAPSEPDMPDEVETAPPTPQHRGTPWPEPTAQPPELAAATGSTTTAVAWALGTALLAGVVWILGRRYRRLVVYPFGAPVVAIALFLTFEHVAALLPSAV